MRTVRSGSASASIGACGDVLVVQVSGLVTGRSLPEIRRNVRAVLPRGVMAVVADYSRAALALSDAEMSDMMAGDEHAYSHLPTAVVCRLECAHDLRRHAINAALTTGRYRRTFLRAEDATRWAQWMAGLIAAHQVQGRPGS